MCTPRQVCDSPFEGNANQLGVNNSVHKNPAPTVKQTLEHLISAVIFLDQTWRVTYLSQQSDPLLAQVREALYGKTLWEVFLEVADSPFFHSYQDELTASLTVHRKAYYPPLRKWFEIHILPLPEGWAVFVQDVTQHKQAEEVLTSGAAIVASSNDAIFSKTLEGVVLTWNSGAERLFGYAASNIVGQHHYMLVPVDRQQELEDIICLLKAGERIHDFDTVRIRKDGSLVEVSIAISPIKDAVGQIIGTCTIARDITQRKAMESQLRLSEHRFRVLTEQSADAIIQVDTQWKIQYASPSTQNMLGYSPEELLGRNAFELIHPADQDRLSIFFGDVLEHGRMHDIECRVLHKDGTFRWIESSGVSLLNESGIHAVVGNYRDITERKQLQERIWQSERQLQAIIESSPACIYVKDVHGRYIRINQQVADLNHLTKEQMLGKTDNEIFPNEIATMAQAYDREVLTTGRAITREVVSQQANSLYAYLSVKFPLCDDSGVPYAVCGISTDITERVLMEQRKDDFISMASHELKTPLTSLLAYTELLSRVLDQENRQKAMHYLSRMCIQLTKLNRLIVDLLDIAKIQESKLVFAEETVVMDNLVRETVSLFQPTAAQHHILIEGEAICDVVGDRDRLAQVIVNLLNNALKYSPEAETIVVSMEKTPNEVIVSIQDFGIGIALQDQERIFERFYRVSDNQEKLFPGLGIGLYLCHKIISYHGGRIWVKSSEGHGATFYFALPRKRA